MSFTFENQGTSTYLVYEIGANDELDTMSLGMLTNNAIPGFASASFTQMDTTKYIKYNVSSKVSVAQLFSGAVNKKRLVGVFSGIVDAMLSAEDYMLDTNDLLLDLNYLFADVSTCETVVVCLPVMNTDHKNPELGMFFKNIIFNTQFDQTENCDHVAQILNYLNSNPVLSLVDFKQLLEKIGKAQEPARVVNPKPVISEPARAVPVTATPQQPAVFPVAPAYAAGSQTQAAGQPKQENLFGTNSASAGQPAVPGGADRSKIPQTPQRPQPPQVPQRPQAPQKPQAPQTQEEKPMSMFYLLQHYNKENAAIYKSQQEAKKAKKNVAAPAAAQPAQPKAAPKQVNAGFAIPGKQESISPAFAIPGQQQNASPAFTVPGQQQKVSPAQKPAQPAAKMNTQPATPKQTVAPVYQQPVYQQPASINNPINFGETTVLGGAIGETTVLGAAAEANRTEPHLIRVKNNEKIPLNKPVFRIGKERSYVDYFIGDNTAISRSHANIVNHGGEYFVVDTNSTNHTYVNGGMIQSNVETKLSHGTKIRLANEDFEFKLY